MFISKHILSPYRLFGRVCLVTRWHQAQPQQDQTDHEERDRASFPRSPADGDDGLEAPDCGTTADFEDKEKVKQGYQRAVAKQDQHVEAGQQELGEAPLAKHGDDVGTRAFGIGVQRDGGNALRPAVRGNHMHAPAEDLHQNYQDKAEQGQLMAAEMVVRTGWEQGLKDAGHGAGTNGYVPGLDQE